MSDLKDYILIVEDESTIAQILVDYLNQSGFTARHLDRGDRVVDLVKQEMPALILLDVMLPGYNGLEVCADIRQFSQVPIIIISARVDELDRLLGLDLGADDYICKPFSPREVVARVKAVLKRLQPLEAPSGEQQPSPEELFHIDDEEARIKFKNVLLDLTPTEFRLLKHLHARPGRVFSRTQLLDLCFPNGEEVYDRVIDSHIKNLRKKLAAVSPQMELIHSVYGIGYRYEQQ